MFFIVLHVSSFSQFSSLLFESTEYFCFRRDIIDLNVKFKEPNVSFVDCFTLGICGPVSYCDRVPIDVDTECAQYVDYEFDEPLY